MSIDSAQKRKAREFFLSEKAQEKVKIEEIGGTSYAFTSELGALRIFRYYNKEVGNPIRGIVGYSQPLQSWFFCLE